MMGVCERVGGWDALVDNAHWRCDSDHVSVAGIGREVDAVARRKKCVETLNEIWISVKEHRHAFNDAWSVDAEWFERWKRGEVNVKLQRGHG